MEKGADLGAAPGGWTKVLVDCGLECTSIDPSFLKLSEVFLEQRVCTVKDADLSMLFLQQETIAPNIILFPGQNISFWKLLSALTLI